MAAPSSKRVKYGKTNRRVFEKYGIGFEGVGNDEFHEQFKTIDFDHLADAELEHHEVVPESIRLLMQYGPEDMKNHMSEWSHVTGYKPVTAEEKLEAEAAETRKIVINDTYLNEKELDEFIEFKTADHMPEESILDQEAPVMVAFTPPEVKWEYCQADELKQNMDPFFFAQSLSDEFSEFVLEFAMSLDTFCTLHQWKQKLKPHGFEPYNKQVVLDKGLQVHYWASRAYHAFLLLMFSLPNKKHLHLHSYFFLRPKEPKPMPESPEQEEESALPDVELFG
jgi:hypothetical protein